MEAAVREERAGIGRFTPLLGVAYAVLFFIGFLITGTPNADAPDSEWTDYFSSGGHRAELIISAFLLVIAAICMLWFVSAVWTRIAAIRGPGGGLSPVPVAAAAVAATGIAIGGVLNAVVAGAIAFDSLPEPSADLLRFSDQLGYPILAIGGMIPLAVVIASLGMQARDAGLIGSRLGTYSMVAAPLTAISFLFFPLLFMLIWFIAAAVSLYRGGALDPATT